MNVTSQILLSSFFSFETVQSVIDTYLPFMLQGVKATLMIALVGTLVGLALGLVVGGLKAIKLDKQAPKWLRIVKKVYDVIATCYIELFRGTPMMVQALFIYSLMFPIIGWSANSCGMFVVSINTGAYMSEIIRSGIQAVNGGQTEAARSLGMSTTQTMFSVVLPQAIKNAFPAIGNEFIVNIKDSSVLSVITVSDLMYNSTRVAGANMHVTETYFVAACIYLTLTLTMSLILRYVEKKINHTSSSIPMSSTDSKNIDLSGGKN